MLRGEGQEGVLEFVVGRGASDSPRAGGVAGELVVDGAGVEDLEDFGLVECALELAGCEEPAGVEQGARDGGGRDVVDDGDVRVGEGGGAMNGDTWVSARGPLRDRDFDPGVAGPWRRGSGRRRAGARLGPARETSVQLSFLVQPLASSQGSRKSVTCLLRGVSIQH